MSVDTFRKARASAMSQDTCSGGRGGSVDSWVSLITVCYLPQT